MAKLNFPDPSESPWLAPTGVVYTFIGSGINGYWSGTELDASTSIEAVFVEVAGDDMSGDLTLGTNKIKLDATTGAGTFVGSGSFGGQLSVNRGLPSNNNAATFLIGNTSTNSAISLNNDGSSDFAGTATFESIIQVGGDPFPGTATGFAAYNDGSIVISSTSPTGSIFRGYTTGTNDATSTIFADGGATFNRYVFSGSDTSHGYFFANAPSGEYDALLIRNATTGGKNTAVIKHDGSASFKGNVNVGDTSTSSGGTQISAAGYLYLRSAAADAATPVIDVYNLNNTKRASINADGSIETRSSLSAADGYSGINTSGTIYANRSNGGDNVFSGAIYGSNTTSTITAAGAATFSDGVGITGKGGADTAFYIFDTANNNATTTSFLANGAATFAGTVKANGTILTRASGDLDVGDRIEKTDTALKALKTAVATVSDFAALKAALITALADV